MKTILALLTITIALSANAQTAVPGDSVRITAPSLGMDKRVGTLIAASHDSLSFRQAETGGDAFSIANSAITRLEVDYGNKSRSNAGKGAVIGAAVGGTLGLLAGISTAHKCRASEITCGTDAGGVAEVTLVMGAVGGAIGALIGLASHSTAWHDVKPGSLGNVAELRLLPIWDPPRRTAGIGAQIRF